jgi:hypothetical protein
MPGYNGMDFSRKDMDLISRAHTTTKLKFDVRGVKLDGSYFHLMETKFLQIVQSAKRIS